jgi:hypothetical protein
VSSAWDRELARATDDRRRIERQAQQLPDRARLSSPSGRRLVGMVRALQRILGRLRARVGSLVVTAGRAVAALPGRAGRRRAAVELTARLGRAVDAPSTRTATCLVYGRPDGPAAESARRAGFATVTAVAHATDDRPAPLEDLVCVLSSTTEPLSDGWLATLAAAIDGEVVAATPMLLRPIRPVSRSTPDDGTVLTAGLDVVLDDRGAPTVVARGAGRRPRPEDRTETAEAAAGCLLVDRRTLDDVGGLAPLVEADAVIGDLCARIRAAGKEIAVVRSAFAIDHAVRSGSSTVVAERAWHAVVERQGPTLWRRAARLPAEDGRLRFAITVAAPSEKLAPRWGDWHLAGGLARALERAGHITRVQPLDHADDLVSRSCDVHLVLRGRERVERSAGQRHVLWVISHPDTLDGRECDRADLVLVASERFASHLRQMTTTPVEVFLQATDHHRFRPLTPSPRYADPIAVVAKSRDQPRPIVMDAIAAGLRPAIYGTGWEAFVDPTLIRAPYVANEDLPLVYSSVGVLLNDHWPTMREWGFVSNRLFDALACGTSVVSDHLQEIGPLFGGAVWTYADRRELLERVEDAGRRSPDHHERVAIGRELVLAHHTFDIRAAALLDLLTRHGLAARPAR